MSNNSYGVVVEEYGIGFGIWHLFSGNDCALSLLDPRACPDALHVGDIVQAKSDGNDSRIVRWWPFSESVWSDGRRVVVRTIVSFTEEVTMRSGILKDERTALSSVLVTSRDIGIVAAPVQWYNREFFEAHENHLFVYVEFLKQSLYNAETDRHAAYYWTIAEDRISLPAVPSSNEHPEKFLEPEKLRKVPALVLARQGYSVFLWSYTLGIHTALLTDERDTFSPGEWIRVMVSRSPDRDFASHGCTYTVVKCRPMSSAQPVARIVDNKITMSLTVNRSEPDPENPRTPVKLWHDYWGLPISYDEAATDWIRGEQSEFRATVEIEMRYTQDYEGRVVTIKAISPAVVPRISKTPAPPPSDSSSAVHPFEDLDELKKALRAEAAKKAAGTTGFHSFEDLDELKKALQMEAADSRDNNNNDEDERFAESDNPWLYMPKREYRKSACNTPQKTPQKADPKTPEKILEECFEDSDNPWLLIPKRAYRKSACNTPQKAPQKTVPKTPEKAEQYQKDSTDSGQAWGDGSQQQLLEKAKSTEKCSDGGKMGFRPVTSRTPVKGVVERGEAASNVPVRAYNDTVTELQWREWMITRGWDFPPLIEKMVIPDGSDGLDHMGPTNFGHHGTTNVPPLPATALLGNRNIVGMAMNCKRLECMITKVRFDERGQSALRIQLFVFEHHAFITHRCDDQYGNNNSVLKDNPEFTTVGNLVDLHVGKNPDGWYVHDEMWRLTGKVQLPMRVAVDHENMVKSLELIVNAKCLEGQERDYSRHRRDNFRTTMLMDYTIDKICYYGDAIDPKDHDDYTFQMIVAPAVDGHIVWKATAVLWRVEKEKTLNPFAKPPPAPKEPAILCGGPSRTRKSQPPEKVELKPTTSQYTHYIKKAGEPIPQESRLKEVLGLYSYLITKEAFLEELHKRTGVDYLDKFSSAIEVGQSAMPHPGSTKKELQLNADLLSQISQNALLEVAFNELGERKAWKRLDKIAHGIKGFTCRSNIH